LYVSHILQENKSVASTENHEAATEPVTRGIIATRVLIKNYSEYKEYALSLINDDRKKHGSFLK
jgi:hypothetical protein